MVVTKRLLHTTLARMSANANRSSPAGFEPAVYVERVAPAFAPRAAVGQPSRFAQSVSAQLYPETQRGIDVWTLFSPLNFPTAVNLGQGYVCSPPGPRSLLFA